MIDRVNANARIKKDANGIPIPNSQLKTDAELTDEDKAVMINVHDKRWGWYLKKVDHTTKATPGIDNAWVLWVQAYKAKKAAEDAALPPAQQNPNRWLDTVTYGDISGAYGGIKGDDKTGLGITPAMLTTLGRQWPDGRFATRFGNGCAACVNYKSGTGGPKSYALTETPHWKSTNFSPQTHAQTVHDNNCECPDGGTPGDTDDEDNDNL